MSNNKNYDANLVGIQIANDEYHAWIGQAELLVEGKPNHIVKQPIQPCNSEFGLWLFSDQQQSRSTSEFKEIESLHEEFHVQYLSIFEGAEKVCDSESLLAIKRLLSKLKSLSNLIVQKLEEDSQVTDEEKVKSNDAQILVEENNEEVTPQMIDFDKKELEAFVPDDIPQPEVSESTKLHRQLKEQDLFQLQQEEQLTTLELKQLDDRKELTLQGVQQLEQYQKLKEQELEEKFLNQGKLEEKNINDIYLSQQNLIGVKEDITVKTEELEQLALVDEKLGQRKAEEKEKEKKILLDFEKSQAMDKRDLDQIELQYKQREDEAESLKKQLALIESELVDLDEKRQLKQSAIDKSNQKKEIKLLELAQNSRLQDRLNGHKVKVKDEKQEELNQLVKDKSALEDSIKALEAKSVTLENQRLDIDADYKKELKELEEQQRFKNMTIEKLDKDKSRKQQELNEIRHQQESIQDSLNEMNIAEISPKKVAEEV